MFFKYITLKCSHLFQIPWHTDICPFCCLVLLNISKLEWFYSFLPLVRTDVLSTWASLVRHYKGQLIMLFGHSVVLTFCFIGLDVFLSHMSIDLFAPFLSFPYIPTGALCLGIMIIMRLYIFLCKITFQPDVRSLHLFYITLKMVMLFYLYVYKLKIFQKELKGIKRKHLLKCLIFASRVN